MPEDASSSRRDSDSGPSFPVVSIELKGAGGEMVRIHRADGSFFVIHAEVFAVEKIRTGEPLDDVRIGVLKERSESIFAREAALRFLSRAAQTRQGLSRKLLSRGFSKSAAAFAINRMIELGYVDDRRFAENWVRFRLSTRKEGWKSLYRGLLRGGVPRAIAEEVLQSACPLEVEMARARLLIHGLSSRTAVSKLTARGFRSKTIGRILSEMRQEGRQETEE